MKKIISIISFEKKIFTSIFFKYLLSSSTTRKITIIKVCKTIIVLNKESILKLFCYRLGYFSTFIMTAEAILQK